MVFALTAQEGVLRGEVGQGEADVCVLALPLFHFLKGQLAHEGVAVRARTWMSCLLSSALRPISSWSFWILSSVDCLMERCCLISSRMTSFSWQRRSRSCWTLSSSLLTAFNVLLEALD